MDRQSASLTSTSEPFVQLAHLVNKNVKRYILTLIKFGLSLGILAYLFNSAVKNEQFELLIENPIQWNWIAIGMLACVGAHLLGFFRWRMMVRAIGLPFSNMDAIRIGFIGLFFNLFAFGVIGGDTLRAFYVTRQIKDRTPEAIASVVADRVIGLLTMCLVASLAFLILDTSSLESAHPEELAIIQYICKTVVILTVLGFSGLLTISFAPRLSNTRLYQAILNLPKIGDLIARLTSVVTIYRSRPGTVAMAFVMSIGVNICFVVTIYSLAVGLTPAGPSFADHFVIEPIAMVSNAVPLPGGIGGMEFAMNLLYLAFSFETGVIVAFAFRFSLLTISAIGAAFWFTNRSKVSGLMEKNADQPVI